MSTTTATTEDVRQTRDALGLTATDVVDHVLGLTPGDPVDRVRRSRPAARENVQATYEALLAPVSDAEISLTERLAVAHLVVALHGPGLLAPLYADALTARDADLAALVTAQAEAAGRAGPYGVYREPGLAGESEPGEAFVADPALGERLAAALTHATLLVLRPRESSPDALRALQEAGWSDDGIVTLSQLVAFLSFQVRLVAGLAVLRDATAAVTSAAPVTTPEV